MHAPCTMAMLYAMQTAACQHSTASHSCQAASLRLLCRVDDIEYSAPQALKVAVAVICLGSGTAIAVLLGKGLQDATWSVSTGETLMLQVEDAAFCSIWSTLRIAAVACAGLGACFAAGIYEVGRPQRFSPAEAQKLEAQWQDFGERLSDSVVMVCPAHCSTTFPFGHYSELWERTPAALWQVS